VKFAFVELMKDTAFTARFDYHTKNRRGFVTPSSVSMRLTKEERKQQEEDNKKYGAGVNSVIVVNPEYEYYHEPERKERPVMQYGKSEQGQINLCSDISQAANQEGVKTVVLSPFKMDSLDTDSFADYALLNEWFYERAQYGSSKYATNLSNKAEIDSLIKRYGTPYVMFTGVEASYLKRVQRPVLYAITCVAVLPVIYAFIPRREFYYDAVVLDLRTGEVVQTESEKEKRGKETDHTADFFKEFFNKLKKPVKPADPKPVAPAGLRD
jgi:hypothetical protein